MTPRDGHVTFHHVSSFFIILQYILLFFIIIHYFLHLEMILHCVFVILFYQLSCIILAHCSYPADFYYSLSFFIMHISQILDYYIISFIIIIIIIIITIIVTPCSGLALPQAAQVPRSTQFGRSRTPGSQISLDQGTFGTRSSHLKGQLVPVSVEKNLHFLMKVSWLGPCVSGNNSKVDPQMRSLTH